LKAQHATDLPRLQHDKINLPSTLANPGSGVGRSQSENTDSSGSLGNHTEEAEILKADYDTEVSRLHHDRSDLQSAFGALKREVAEAK
jgi:hypothetical protein